MEALGDCERRAGGEVRAGGRGSETNDAGREGADRRRGREGAQQTAEKWPLTFLDQSSESNRKELSTTSNTAENVLLS